MGEVIKTKAGELEVLETWVVSSRHKHHKFLCFCGKTFVARRWSITSGVSSSCGCYNSISSSVRAYVHGHSGYDRKSKTYNPTTVYSTWCNMRRCCNSPGNRSYPIYGGKGIKVCDEWLEFETFLADMGEKPANHRLLRINKEGDFEPDNCEWVPVKGKRRKK